MKNIIHPLLTAWYELLNGRTSVPVYRTDVPPDEDGDYILLRPESETDNTNNARFVTSPVIITEVVTKHKIRINDEVAPSIDNEIVSLLYGDKPGTHNLPIQEGINITNVIRQNATYLQEDDGVHRIHSLVTRNLHRVLQIQ